MIANRFFDVLMFSLIAVMLVTVFVTGGATTRVLFPDAIVGWLKQLVILSGAQAPSIGSGAGGV